MRELGSPCVNQDPGIAKDLAVTGNRGRSNSWYVQKGHGLLYPNTRASYWLVMGSIIRIPIDIEKSMVE